MEAAMFATFEDINEIEKFEADVRRYIRGEINEERFKKIRLNMGVYGQRQKQNNHMQRIKIPLGLLTSEQARRIASVTDKYSAGIIHITTRQDIQIHFVKIENTPALMRELAEKGITTREACGNTVRNVTACCWSGICPEEKFDVTRDGIATAKHNIRYELTQNLPRKFKISFSGCRKDCGLERIHDIGFIATANSSGNYYSIFIGGGLGPFPRLNHLLKEEVESGEIFRYTDEIIRYFDLEGNRKERNKARFKFVFEKYGSEKVLGDILRNVEAAGEYPQKERYSHPYLDAQPAHPPEILQNGILNTPWFKKSVVEQKQRGYYAFEIRPEIGDMTPDQMRLVADLVERYGNGTMRTTNRQTIVVPWISGGVLEKFFADLCKYEELVRSEEPHCIACPGRDTCNLGITSSRTLARELNRALKGRIDHTVRVNISGCQNSCAQHHMGAIGFYGAAAKRGGRQVPFYFVLAGGRASEKGTNIGKVILKIPAKNIAPVSLALFDLYEKEKLDGERPEDFFIRVGVERLREYLIPFGNIPSYEEDPEFYRDRGQSKDFDLEDMGEGECAGAAIDLLDLHIWRGDQALKKAGKLLDTGDDEGAKPLLVHAAACYARGVLATFGKEVEEDMDAISLFESIALPNRLVSFNCAGIKEVLLAGNADNISSAVNILRDEVKAAIDRLDQDFRIAPLERPEQCAAATSGEINLRGVPCPLNYVRARALISQRPASETLCVIIDRTANPSNVIRSLRDSKFNIFNVDYFEEEVRIYLSNRKGDN